MLYPFHIKNTPIIPLWFLPLINIFHLTYIYVNVKRNIWKDVIQLLTVITSEEKSKIGKCSAVVKNLHLLVSIQYFWTVLIYYDKNVFCVIFLKGEILNF